MIRLVASDGQRDAAAVAYLLTSHSTASVLSGVPCRLGNSGEPGWASWAFSHSLNVVTVPAVKGAARAENNDPRPCRGNEREAPL